MGAGVPSCTRVVVAIPTGCGGFEKFVKSGISGVAKKRDNSLMKTSL